MQTEPMTTVVVVAVAEVVVQGGLFGRCAQTFSDPMAKQRLQAAARFSTVAWSAALEVCMVATTPPLLLDDTPAAGLVMLPC